MSETWRAYFRPIIAEVIGCFSPGDDPAYIRKAVLASWPEEALGRREHWPYRVWLSEVRRQLARRHDPGAQPLDDLPLFRTPTDDPTGARA